MIGGIILWVWGIVTSVLTAFALKGEADPTAAVIGWLLLIIGAAACADEAGRPPVRY